MTAFNENALNDQNENLGHTRPTDEVNTGQMGEVIGSVPLESNNPYTKAENLQSSGDPDQEEGYGENSGIQNVNSMANSDQTRGPGGEDDDFDDDDDDDDLFDDEDDDTLIPIEGDEEDDSLLGADDDEDVIPGTDLDDGDDLLDDDDLDDDDSSVNRSTMGDLGSNVTGRNNGRSTGRMSDHEPGAGGV